MLFRSSNNYLNKEFVITKINTNYKDGIINLTISAPIGDESLIPKNRVYKIKTMGSKDNKVINLIGLKEHKISISLKINKEYIFEYEIMNILLDAKIETHIKADIGFIGNLINKEKGGILSLDISKQEKVKKINELKMDHKIKKMVNDLILKH